MVCPSGHGEVSPARLEETGRWPAPQQQGKRVRFTGDTTAVSDGPFAEPKELVAVFEAEDFGEELTSELRAQEDRIRAEAARNQMA